MLTRRFFTQALASTFAWLAGGTLTKAVEVVSEVVAVDVPIWCPKGWLPVMGQKITAEQFPDLFMPADFSGQNARIKRFKPLFFGKQSAHLESFTPIERTMLSQCGWQDNLTHSQHGPDNKVIVQVIAVEHQRHANGGVWPAGFRSSILVAKDEFERDYGPVLPNQGGSNGMFYTGYESPAPLVDDKVRANIYQAAELEVEAERVTWRASRGT